LYELVQFCGGVLLGRWFDARWLHSEDFSLGDLTDSFSSCTVVHEMNSKNQLGILDSSWSGRQDKTPKDAVGEEDANDHTTPTTPATPTASF
jgi:hypothetical protein